MTEINDIKKSETDQIPNESYLEPFYADILAKQFKSSAESIDYCRKLCAQYGFTIKQEASTYRNIYVYCSREGFPDSLRNPKSNPKRRRPSKRCDCRWRIVLNESEGKWAFRKSLNPEASKHNHELMKPEEIETSWPKEMLDLICKLARERLPTPDIRTRVQLVYPHISWNERRFYNRLSEERQKIRIRDAQQRVKHLNHIWSNLCTAAAGSQELVDIVSSEMNTLLDKVCKMTQTDPSTLIPPNFLDNMDHPPSSMDENHSNDELNDNGDSSSQDEPTTKSPKNQNKASNSDAPKGFTKITLPEQNYYIKLHPHRILQDVQQLYRRRSRSLAFSDDCSSEFGQYPDEMTLKKHKSMEAEYNDLSNFSNRPMDPQQPPSMMPTNTTTMASTGHFMYPPQNCKDQQQYYASNIYPSFHPPPTSTNLSPRYNNHTMSNTAATNTNNNTNTNTNHTNTNNHPDQSMDLYSRQQLHHIPSRTSPPLDQQQHPTTDLTTQTMTPVSMSNHHPPNSPMTPAPTNLSTQPPLSNNITLMHAVQNPPPPLPPPQAYMMDQQQRPPPHPHHQQQHIYYTHLPHDNNNNNHPHHPNDQTTYYMNPRMHTH